MKLPETVPELIKIIKKKKLYRRACFHIGVYDKGKGDYTSESYRVIAGISEIASDSEGIYRDEHGVWEYFERDERGGEEWRAENYTESEACQELLKYMTSDRFRWRRWIRKSGMEFPERWFYTDEIDY